MDSLEDIVFVVMVIGLVFVWKKWRSRVRKMENLIIEDQLELNVIFGCVDKLLQFKDVIVISEMEKAFGPIKGWPEHMDEWVISFLLDALQAPKKDLDLFNTPEPLEEMNIDPSGVLEICFIRKWGCPEEDVGLCLSGFQAMARDPETKKVLDPTFGIGRRAMLSWMGGDLKGAFVEMRRAISEWKKNPITLGDA